MPAGQGRDRPALTRRILAIANALSGMNRAEAASSAGMDRQTLRDWVIRYNAHGVAGLVDRWAGGRPAILDETQQLELLEVVLKGPDPVKDGFCAFTPSPMRPQTNGSTLFSALDTPPPALPPAGPANCSTQNRPSSPCPSRLIPHSPLHLRRSASRDFVPRRFSDVCRQRAWMDRHAGIRKPAQQRSLVRSCWRTRRSTSQAGIRD